MGTRALWYGTCWLTLVLFVTKTGSDWLSCAQIQVCHCKWSSGKKTASCISGGLIQPPHLSADIQVLDINGNPLRTLQKDAFASIDMLNLQRLNLSSTNLRTLHPDAFRELRILIELDLSQNELQYVSPDTFKGNDRLRLLVLSDNPLNVLVAEQFPPLQHLKKIELSKCKLRKIHPWAFVHLRTVETVNLHQNLLRNLHQDTLNLPLLKTLTLSENPWYCDCRLRNFHDWFVSSNLGNEEVLCNGPDNKTNISWRNIRSSEFVCPPEALASPTVIRTEAGADISFGCFARGDPKPKMTWFFHSVEVLNETYKNSEIIVQRHAVEYLYDYSNDILNMSAQWLNVTINNVTNDLAGEWTCKVSSYVGDAKVYLTLVLPKARIATARAAPDYSAFFAVGATILGLTSIGFLGACFCWKTRRRRLPPSRSLTDQEKKLLDTSLAVSCDTTRSELGSTCGFEMLDRSMSLESDERHCIEPVQITIEPHGFPPPPAEFALPAPYGNIFISVQVSGHNDEYPDLLGGGATLPRRSRTCFLKSDYDNMGPRITAAGSSVWSLPGSNGDSVAVKEAQEPICMSTFSTEFTAL